MYYLLQIANKLGLPAKKKIIVSQTIGKMLPRQ
jgi:hypothetical protein